MNPLPPKVWEALVLLQTACAESALQLDTIELSDHDGAVSMHGPTEYHTDKGGFTVAVWKEPR
jgi:hypothetical protein